MKSKKTRAQLNSLEEFHRQMLKTFPKSRLKKQKITAGDVLEMICLATGPY